MLYQRWTHKEEAISIGNYFSGELMLCFMMLVEYVGGEAVEGVVLAFKDTALVLSQIGEPMKEKFQLSKPKPKCHGSDQNINLYMR